MPNHQISFIWTGRALGDCMAAVITSIIFRFCGSVEWLIAGYFQAVHLQILAEVGLPCGLPPPLRRFWTPCSSHLQLPSPPPGSPGRRLLHRQLQHGEQLPCRLHARAGQVVSPFLGLYFFLPVDPGVLLTSKVFTPSRLLVLS